MSVINNIQGSMTQSQQPQQIQQQQGDQARVQQDAGQVQTKNEEELRKNSISKQEDVEFSQVKDESQEKDQRKNKRKQKTLEEQQEEDNLRKGSLMFGGGLIDTQA